MIWVCCSNATKKDERRERQHSATLIATVPTLIFMEKGYDIYVGCMARADLIIIMHEA